MRKSHSTQRRFDCEAIENVELNLECRDEIIPILFALQHIYGNAELRDEVLRLVGQDVNATSRPDRGRDGFGYWQILVLAAVRLGCKLDYDRLQDLAENHRKLRHLMGIGQWDEKTSFTWKRIRDNVCLLKPQTIAAISDVIVAEGHRLNPEAAKTARVDSFVVETNIHYPTESSLLWDGLRKIIELSALVAIDLDVPDWRQQAHLRKKIKNLHREISRVAASKKPSAKKKLKKLYAKLLKQTKIVLERAEKLVKNAAATDMRTLGRIEQIRTFIERTRQVAGTAYRRVIRGETVPNEDKLFSIFEPHTQLYRRGKAGQENQFGRLVMVYEDGAGFVTHHYLMARDEQDADVTVEQTRIVQERLGGAMEEISFDRGFYSKENESDLKQMVASPCLPKRGMSEFAEQIKNSSVEFRAARQRHPGVESAIGALQSGNGLKRSRDRSEIGFERYLALGFLGRNLHILGKLLIIQHSPTSLAGQSKRKQAA
jgi:hypothetical protein